MRKFDEIEEKEARLSVHISGETEGSGVLTLDRANTLLTLSTKDLFHPPEDVNGWFDVKVRHGQRSILLRNSLFMSQTDHGTRNEVWETGIFPNMVIFNAEALDKNNRVRSVLFRLEKLDDFFNHHVIEHQYLFETPKEVFRSLKRLRKHKFSKQYPVRYDFHKPDSVYLVHRPPRILAFEALGNKYEAHWGMWSRGMGWDGIQVKAEPFGSIAFGEPKTIDEAIDEIWVWKRLYCQLAMERLDLTCISARGSKKRMHADIYLSNAEKKNDKKKFDVYAFRGGQAPFSSWKERKRLGAAMAAWVSKERARHIFRVNVDRVIHNLREGVNLEDVVTLCSAVESLDELKSPDVLSDKDMSKIAKGAIAGASDAGIAIDPTRIRSIIGLLRHQSLPQRLKLLMAALAPTISEEQGKKIVSGALNLRAVAAHGGSVATLSIPRVRPIVVALAGCCILYDLLTSEFPAKANDSYRLRATRQIGDALNWVTRVERKDRGF